MKHLNYNCQIVTDLGFVFKTVVLQSEAVGAPNRTKCQFNVQFNEIQCKMPNYLEELHYSPAEYLLTHGANTFTFTF